MHGKLAVGSCSDLLGNAIWGEVEKSQIKSVWLHSAEGSEHPTAHLGQDSESGARHEERGRAPGHAGDDFVTSSCPDFGSLFLISNTLCNLSGYIGQSYSPHPPLAPAYVLFLFRN